MKLSDFENSKKNIATRALKENFDFTLRTEKLNLDQTTAMLKQVRGLLHEARTSHASNSVTPSYMKLQFMNQALQERYSQIVDRGRKTNIVVENEAVEEAQVTLAAQDLCNSVQKMLKDVGKMQIEELPALVDGIESEIGTNEAKAYEEAVGAQLETLSSALKEAFSSLKNARDALTGAEGASFSPEAGDEEMNAGADEMPSSDMNEPEMPEMPEMPEEPSEEPVAAVGRGKR